MPSPWSHPHLPVARITDLSRTPVSRRSFLVGSAVLLTAAACGSDGESTSGTTTSIPGEVALGVFFPPNGFVHTGAEQRLPFGVFVDGFPATQANAPTSISVRFVPEGTEDADVESTTLTAAGAGMPRPYYVARHTFETPGTWRAVAEIDGRPGEATFAVSDPSEVAMVKVGDTMPVVATPTVDDHMDVEPLCTADPPCPLHDTSLSDALDLNQPVALLVSTPAFCQTQVCGPVLDLLVDEAASRQGMGFIHAEVYANPGTSGTPDPAPIMGALGLTYEPVLYLVDSGGTVVDRLDVIFDKTELAGALDRLGA